jgi:hypothetical protein
VTTRSFWPPVEPAQIDYEALRGHVLDHGRLPEDLAAARFARRGLGGLISWPVADPIYVVELLGSVRPAWTPHGDPRVEALAAGFGFLLEAAGTVFLQAELAELAGIGGGR